MTSGNHACEAKPTAGASDPRMPEQRLAAGVLEGVPGLVRGDGDGGDRVELPTGWLRRITFARGS